jgi:hypothetical protein
MRLGEFFMRARSLPALALALTGALALPQAAGAAVVYNEAINGDTGDTFSSPAATVALGLGQNDILGSVTFSFFFLQPPTDMDVYSLVVATGQRIQSITISMTLRNEGSGLFEFISWYLTGASDVPGFAQMPVTVSDFPAFGNLMPIGEGSYRLEGLNFTGAMSPGEFRTADYSVTVNVEAVPTPIPLPAGAGLLAASLGLLTVLRRRRT